MVLGNNAVILQLLNLGEAAWHIGFPPNRFHHLARFMRIPHHQNIPKRVGRKTLKLLFSADLNHYFSGTRTVKLAEKDALPCTKAQCLVFYQDLFATAEQ